jgi:hypothetical protein
MLEVSFRAASPRALAMGFSLFMLTGLLTYTNVQQNRVYLQLVERGDLAELKSYTRHATYINARQYLLFGVTPLEVAVHKQNLPVVKFLISAGADPSKGSGFSSPIDIALMQKDWVITDYLFGQVTDSWLSSNSSRLFKMSVKEESGKALDVLLVHRLQRFLKEEELQAVVDRVVAQRSVEKMAALSKAGLIPDKTRAPASIK